jgi:predicted RNase H-like HicB family nuclease
MAKYFTLEYWRDEGWYVGRLKEVPGVFSQGHTLEELKENILDAYNLMIEEDEEALPSVIRDKMKQIRVEI